MTATVTVAARAATRWRLGHPWIYRSDVRDARTAVRDADVPAGIVHVHDARKRFLGQALWSPSSEIRLRQLSADEVPIDREWWRRSISAALTRRGNPDASAYRVVHAEGDGLPSLVIDRYGGIVVAQFLSAGLEAVAADVRAAIVDVLAPEGILLRNDASVRRHEGLPLVVAEASGRVPDVVAVREGRVRYEAAVRTGQKTGAFLDQRDNRTMMGSLASGRALDVFTYEGLFALHMAAGAREVVAVDSSAPALERARRNAALNGVSNITWIEENAFDLLRRLERAGERFDTIILDPPAFAKRKEAVERALAGYNEINLRAMRLLAPGGVLFTASCSFHVGRGAFFEMLARAGADSGRRLVLERIVGQSSDHPELLMVPETGYLKGAVLREAG